MSRDYDSLNKYDKENDICLYGQENSKEDEMKKEDINEIPEVLSNASAVLSGLSVEDLHGIDPHCFMYAHGFESSGAIALKKKDLEVATECITALTPMNMPLLQMKDDT